MAEMMRNLRKLRDIAQKQMDDAKTGETMIAFRWHKPFAPSTVHRHRIEGNFLEIRQTKVTDSKGVVLYGLIGKREETERNKKRKQLDQMQMRLDEKADADERDAKGEGV